MHAVAELALILLALYVGDWLVYMLVDGNGGRDTRRVMRSWQIWVLIQIAFHAFFGMVLGLWPVVILVFVSALLQYLLVFPLDSRWVLGWPSFRQNAPRFCTRDSCLPGCEGGDECRAPRCTPASCRQGCGGGRDCDRNRCSHAKCRADCTGRTGHNSCDLQCTRDRCRPSCDGGDDCHCARERSAAHQAGCACGSDGGAAEEDCLCVYGRGAQPGEFCGGGAGSGGRAGHGGGRRGRDEVTERDQRKFFFDTAMFLVAGAVGALLLPQLQLPAGGHDAMAGGPAMHVWIGLVVLGLAGMWAYEEVLREHASHATYLVLTNVRGYAVLVLIYFFFAGVLTGAPLYYAVGLLFVLFVFEWAFCSRRDWREPNYRYLEDFVLSVFAFWLGSAVFRDLTMPITPMSDRLGLTT